MTLLFARARFGLCLASMVAACGGHAVTPAAATGANGAPADTDGPALDPQLHVRVAGPLLAPMPLAVTSFGGARDDRYLYVLGGYAGTPHDYSREGQSRSVWRLALDGSDAWTEITRMPQGLQGLSALTYAGRICRFGGNAILNAREEETRMESSKAAACFDPTSRRWSALPDMPQGRSSHESTLIGSTVYVVGGWQLQGGASTGTFHRELWSIDLAAAQPQWTSVEAPFQRRALGVASCAGKVVAIGGLTEGNEVSQRVDIFDPATGTWAQGPDFPSNAFGLAAASDGKHVYASARDGVIHRLAPGEATWEHVATLAFPRFFHQLVAANDHVIAFGGISGMHTHGRTRHVERIAITPHGSPHVATVASVQLDFPGTAKNRSAVFVHDDFLYMFGGNNSLEQHDFEPHNFVAEGFRLHLSSLRWERIADYPAARQTMQTVVLNDRAIAVGGFGHNGTQAITHPDAYSFDFERERWSPINGLDRGRTQFGLTAHGDALWIFGGLNYDPDRPEAFDHVLSILRAPAPTAERSSAFETIETKLPAERRAFAGETLGDRYYLVGGMRDNFGSVNDCKVFDFNTRTFSDFVCPSHPRVSAELVAIEQRMYLVAGMARTEGLTPDRSVEMIDMASSQPTWSTLINELPFDTRHMRALNHNDRILLVSTHLPEQRMQLAWIAP